jgi:hypothetical protein
VAAATGVGEDGDARAMALCAYGNGYLAGRLPLESWHRHYQFYGVALQFRQPDGGLWAGDWVHWLRWQKLRGASRLVLLDGHELAALLPEAADSRGLCGLVCYLPGAAAELWWRRDEPVLAPASDEDYPFEAYWAAELDCYWQHPLPQAPALPAEADWDGWTRQIRADLAHETALGDGAECFALLQQAPVPYLEVASSAADWQRYPLVPFLASNRKGHRLLAVLDRLQGWHANFTHFKNDSSSYQHWHDAERQTLAHWSGRLDGWHGRVCLALANAVGDRAAAARVPDAEADADAEHVAAAAWPAAGVVDPPSRLTRSIALLVAIAVAALVLGALGMLLWHYPVRTLCGAVVLYLLGRWSAR